MAKIPVKSKFIGIATEDGKIIVSGGFDGSLEGDMYMSPAHTAMKTLPRIVQRMIYRYAKWRLR